MNNVIRKISIGSDYKNDAMHYSVGQQVYGGQQNNAKRRFYNQIQY